MEPNKSTPEEIQPSLGERIRQRRRERDLTLTELAEMCKLSTSFLSQIERDQANPSISTLHEIANVLGAPLAHFFSDALEQRTQENLPAPVTINSNSVEEKSAQVVRANNRKTLIYPGSGIRNELLSPDLNRAIQMMWVVIPPGADTGNEPLIHEGEECGVVLQGQVEIWAGDEHYILGPGDAIYQKSTIPHRSRNIGDSDVIVVVAITPPSF